MATHELSNVELESSAISTFLHDKSASNYLKLFYPQMFTGIRSHIFNEMKTLITTNESVSTVIIKNNLAKNGHSPLDAEISFKHFSQSLSQDSGSLISIAYELKELYFRRVSKDIARKIREASDKGDTFSALKYGNAISKLHEKVFLKDVDRDQLKELIEEIGKVDEFIRVPSSRLFEKMGGYTLSDLSSIGGKSSHNKTTFSVHQSVQAIKAGYIDKLLFVSVDEPAEKILRRILASEANISLSDMRYKKVDISYDDVKKILEPIMKHFIILDDVFSPDEIYRAILDYKPQQTIVDHLQELHFPGEQGITEQGITYSLKQFKRAARYLKSNVLNLSQVRDKSVDERFDDKVPRPHDFYYASTIRQKSREQCVVYWKYKDTHEEDEKSIFEFYVWKSTYSDTGKVTFKYEPEYARFTEMTLDESREVTKRRAESAPIKQFKPPQQKGERYYEW